MKRLALLIAVTFTLSGAPDVLQQLDVPKADAAMEVLNGIASGSPNYHRVRQAFKAAAPAARSALVEQVLTWARAYVDSPQFARDYAKHREEVKPQPPEAGESVEQELARQKQEQERQLAEMKKALKDMPAEMRNEMEKSIKETEQAFREMNENAEFQAAMRENAKAEREADQQTYNEQLETWKAEFPADPRALVKRRLQEFLAATEDVDFDAKLVARGSKMRFANDDYEAKDSEWKLAYRAGKPATEAARAFVKTWLAELR